jgi:hypothetical protein
MAAISTAFTLAWRDYNTDGVPGSGIRNTPKSDLRALGGTIESVFLNAANTVSAPSTAAPAGYAQRFVGKDGDANQIIVMDAFGGVPALRLRRANGTGAAATAVASGDTIGEAQFTGYYVTGGPAYDTFSASLRAVATENWTSALQGTQLVFKITPTGSATPLDSFWMGQDGSFLSRGVLGYQTANGAGATVSQATSRTTGVTLNKPTGQITMFGPIAGASAGQTFTLTNSFITANDTVVCSVTDASVTGVYYFGVKVGTGLAKITMFNPGANVETPVVNFTIYRGAAS